jgi:hypothetical protein
VNTYAHYSFDNVDLRAAFAYNTLGEWHALTAYTQERLWDTCRTIADDGLRAQELEFVDKLAACWRYKGRGTLALTSDVKNVNKEQAHWLEDELRYTGLEYSGWIAKQGATRIRYYYNNADVPLRRGKGAPYWTPGTDPDAYMMYAAAVEQSQSNSFESVIEYIRELGNARAKEALSAYVRIQSGRNPVVNYDLVGGMLEKASDDVILPKRRRISALGVHYNYVLVGVGEVIKQAMKGTSPRIEGTIAYAQQLCREYKYFIASDLSTYDESISYETIEQWIRLILTPVLNELVRMGVMTRAWANMCIEVVERVQTLDLYTPPVRVDEAARLSSTYGTNKSGIRVTSVIASTINDARTKRKVKDLKLRADWSLFGDDLVVASDDRRLPRDWASTDFNNHGFTETIAADTSFLMRHIPEGYTYLGRMSNFNREVTHEPTNIYVSALGTATRRGLLRGHPKEEAYLRIMRESPSKALRTSCALVESVDPTTLAMMAANSITPATTNDVTEDTVGAINDCLSQGLISRDGAIKALQLVKEVSGHTSMRYGELRASAVGITKAQVKKWFGRTTYTDDAYLSDYRPSINTQ